MKATFFTVASLATMAHSLVIPAALEKRQTISITPHDQFASSMGVLGCKINTNRVAYFPGSPGCDGGCLKVSANGRSVNLLHIDSSGGAYDMSYDAWNYLYTGHSATVDPQSGGGFDATYEKVDMSQCADLIKTSSGKLAFSAPNGINSVVSCVGSWIGQNSELVNIQDSDCTMGYDEVCTLDLNVSNQPSCPHLLGSKNALTTAPVYNILYPSGEKKLAP